MSLSFHASLVVVLLSVVAAVALSVYIYRHTVPVVSRPQKYTLIFLRSFAFTLTLLALFEPLLTLSSPREERPAVALLIDNSFSMSHRDNAGSRDSIVRSLLSGNGFNMLQSKTALQLYKFSYATFPLMRDSLRIEGSSTNISSALQTVIKETPTALQSIILVTDGNYNAGSNPLYDAERSRLPIYTVGVGDTSEQQDVSVSRIIANAIGYVDASLPIDATIKSTGITSSRVTVALMEDGKKIDEKIITLSSSESGPAETPVQFSYTPKSDGIKKLTIRVPARNGELNSKNNSRSTRVKILKSKISVVVAAGSPSADVATVMQSLNSDKNISAQLFLQLPSGELKPRSGGPSFSQAVLSADCVVLIGFPTPATPAQLLQTIVQTVQSRPVSLLFIAGRTIDMLKVRDLEPVLPFTVVSGRADEQLVVPSVVPQYKYHALVNIDAQQFPLFAWEKLPPVYSSFQSYAAKPEALTLMRIKIQGVELQNPLLVIRTVATTAARPAAGKSLALLGYGIQRWKLLAGASEETRGVFDVWFSSVVRWLATHEQDSRLTVEPTKELFSQGEPVEFTGQVYNENFQPMENAEVHISVGTLGGEQVTTFALRSIGSGRYEGVAAPLNEGEYVYRAVSFLNGDTLASASGRFSVGEQSLEFAETKLNKPLLQQIASTSGGTYVDAMRFDSLVQTLLSRPDMKPQQRIHTSEFELWNLPAYLSLVILLFAAEWFLRKRWGML
ncbi:MAG: vWA domain-containing protein [Bacteroidota bacterium]